jgi:initiation factor 1A
MSKLILKFQLEYAQVQKMLGDGRVALHCFDNVARTGLIRGTMRRRVWINTVSDFFPFPIPTDKTFFN